MAQVSYQDVSVESDDPHILLTNRRNDYLALGSPNTSSLHGMFIKDGRTYWKTLANILPLSGKRADTVELSEESAIRRFGDMSQDISFHDTGLRMECRGEFVITADCKRMYDEDTEGRMYDISLTPAVDSASQKTLAGVSVGILTYTKQPPGATRAEYTLYLAVATTMALGRADGWRETEYWYDRRRGTGTNAWVYGAFSVKGNGHMAIAAGTDKGEAQSRAFDILMGRTGQKKGAEMLPERSLAESALAALITERGIMAGLPWFYKEWSRDELISLGGVIASGNLDHAIKVVDKWFSTVGQDGALPAIFPAEGLESVDAPGWLGRRTTDILKILADAGDALSSERLAVWRTGAERMLQNARSRMRDGLVWTGYNTTWMDTAWQDDGREGACIEIQALTLALHEAYLRLCAKEGTEPSDDLFGLGDEILGAVRSSMVDGDVLFDRIRKENGPDTTARPNIFLAWYAYPDLFPEDQWSRFFHRAIPELWLEWGGLSSISKGSANFHGIYSGEDVMSYHRGDSWYFVNNIAAIAMHSIDPDGFKAPVMKILRASVRDMFSCGFVGHCSEVSSAGHQEPCGCWAQAWSASTLVELLDKVVG